MNFLGHSLPDFDHQALLMRALHLAARGQLERERAMLDP